jgi:hypothetical protein
MGGGCPVRLSAPKRGKNILQFVTASDDDPDGNRSKVKKKAKVVQIPIEERILVVPFNFHGDAVLEAIHRVRWRVHHVLIHGDARRKALLDSSLFRELRINPPGHFGFPPAPDGNVTLAKAKPGQDIYYVSVLLREILTQNGAGMSPLVYFVIVANEFRELTCSHFGSMAQSQLRFNVIFLSAVASGSLSGRATAFWSFF